MAKLVLSAGGTIVHQRFVDDVRLTVGREPHNDIVVDDPSVSRDHAAITPVGNDHILEDLRSANGTIIQLAQTNYEDFEGRIKRRPADAGDTCPTQVADEQVTDNVASAGG